MSVTDDIMKRAATTNTTHQEGTQRQMNQTTPHMTTKTTSTRRARTPNTMEVNKSTPHTPTHDDTTTTKSAKTNKTHPTHPHTRRKHENHDNERKSKNATRTRRKRENDQRRTKNATRRRRERETSERGRANEDEGRRWWGVIPPPTPPSAAHSPQCSCRSRAPIVVPSTRCIGGYSTPKPPGPRGAFPFASPLVTTAPLTVRRSPPHYMLTRYPHSLRFIHFIHYMSVGSLPPPQPRHFVCFAPRRGYRVQRHPTTSAAHNCFGRAG